jgi:hypothetical protein
MRRRELVRLAGGAAVAWPFAARAQQSDRIARLAVLAGYGENDPLGKTLAAALVQGLGAFGWRAGENLLNGFSDYDPPIAGKWVQMLTQITPPVARVAVLYDPASAPFAGLLLRAIEAAAPSFAVTVQAAPVRQRCRHRRRVDRARPRPTWRHACHAGNFHRSAS